MSWKEHMETISPDDRLEIASKEVYYNDLAFFNEQGFTPDIFEKLYPIIKQQVWSMFGLWSLVHTMTPPDAKILEIGSGNGGSLSLIHLANPTAELTNIDPFCLYDEETWSGLAVNACESSLEEFEKNLSYIGFKAQTIIRPSEDAVDDVQDNYFDLIFIDGNHGYEYVMQDIINYERKAKSKAIICGHDYHTRFPGVIKAVKEMYKEDFDVLKNSSIWFHKK